MRLSRCLTTLRNEQKYDKYGEQWRNADAYEQAGGFSGGAAGGGGGSPFEGSTSTVSAAEAVASAASSRTYSVAEGVVHRALALVSHTADRTLGRWKLLLASTMYTALLGGEVVIQLSTGQKLKLKVKPLTQGGTKVRLRGKGSTVAIGTFGDLIITYNVKLPDHLSDHQKELLEQMRREG